MQFPALFSPFRIGAVTLRNRIFSTGHDTYLPEGGLPSEALTAYHLARARGGAGLIIVQVVGVHETARYTDAMLMGTEDACIAPFAAERLVCSSSPAPGSAPMSRAERTRKDGAAESLMGIRSRGGLGGVG